MGYKKIIIKGAGLMVALRIITQVAVSVKLIILARILQPADFGIFAVIVTILTILDTVSDLGFSYAAIHMQVRMQDVARTFLTVTIIRGALQSLILIACIPLITLFFKNSALTSPLLLSSLIPLIKGFLNPYVVDFQKELIFEKQFIYQLFPTISISIATVIFAFLKPGVYPLVFGLIIGSIIEIATSYGIAERNFKNKFEKKHFISLFSYGKWITAGGLATYLATQLDTITIGRLLGASSLGLYDLAFKTGSTAFNEITNVLSQIMFPVYSKVQQDRKRLKKLFLRHLATTTLLAVCINIPLFLFPKEIILVVFGSKWIQAYEVLRILSIYGLLRAAIGPIGPLLLSIGKPNSLAKINLLHAFIITVLIIPLTMKYRITGAAIAMAVAYLLITPVYALKAFKSLR